MRCYYDTEFLEDGRTIELISIGMAAEDGRELYAVNRDAPWDRIVRHDWLMANVWPSLPLLHGDARKNVSRKNPATVDFDDPAVMPHQAIAGAVAEFLQAIPDVELWAWYGAYDHVALSQLWGPMIAHPDGVPMWTNDLKQEHIRLGSPDLPEQAEGEHNALADARHNKVIAAVLDQAASDQ